MAELLVAPESRHHTLPEIIPSVNFQDLTNLACWLDVVTTILATHDHPQAQELFEALIEGARYNGNDIADLAQELLDEKCDGIRDYSQLNQDLIDCCEALIQQLTLVLEEQRTTREQRI